MMTRPVVTRPAVRVLLSQLVALDTVGKGRVSFLSFSRCCSARTDHYHQFLPEGQLAAAMVLLSLEDQCPLAPLAM